MKSNKPPNKPTSETPAKSSWFGPAMVAAALAVTAGIVFGALWYTSPSRSEESAVGSEETSPVVAMIATLSPDLFTGKARDAYQVAKEIPEILQHMPCFCGCPRLGHKNNLYCFADKHGEDCDMCMDIALETRDLHREGKSVKEIYRLISTKFGPESRQSR